MWGSVALGDYVHGQSDIDLLLVSPKEADAGTDGLLQEIAADGQWSMDVLAITEETLASPAPVCSRLLDAGAPYELHGMDLVQLREYSAPLAGAAIDDLVEFRDTKTEARSALQHVLGVMVPGHVEACASAGASECLPALRLNIEFVLVRCLYSLKHGVVGSKRTAAAWASEEYQSDSTYGIIGQVGTRLLAYRRGDGTTTTHGVGAVSEFSALAEATQRIMEARDGEG